MPACLPFSANSYGGWGGGGHRVVGDMRERMPSLPLGSPKLPLKQEELQKNAVAPRIMGRGREQLPAPSLWGGSLPLNLKIPAGGLHSLHPHSTKCFMGGSRGRREEKEGGNALLWSSRKKEAQLGLLVAHSRFQRPAGSRRPKSPQT